MEHDQNLKSTTQEDSSAVQGNREEVFEWGPWSIAYAVKKLLKNIPDESTLIADAQRKACTLTATAEGKIEPGGTDTTKCILYERPIPFAFSSEAERARIAENISKSIITNLHPIP